MLAAVAAIVLLVAGRVHGDEPRVPPGSIPAIGYRPEVVGYYRPALVRAPSLFPRIIVRYRRAYVFEPISPPAPKAADCPPVEPAAARHFSFE